MKLRIYQIIEDTKVEGPGNRTCIFVQGCLKCCPGCNSRQTWDINAGYEYEIDDLNECSIEPDRQAEPDLLYESLDAYIDKDENIHYIVYDIEWNVRML